MAEMTRRLGIGLINFNKIMIMKNNRRKKASSADGSTRLTMTASVVKEFIKIRGAREHNLKNIDLDLPINDFIVFTGLSGSGKSSLAFDTLYAEGQRRYVESLSAYARQFLGIMSKPDVDSIKGLSPAISIEQKSTSRNPRSTVGTVTEIYDYLRLLFARIGQPHCPKCGTEISAVDAQTIVDQIFAKKNDVRITIMASIVRHRKGTYEKLLENLLKQGYSQARVNGQIYTLPAKVELSKYQNHNIEAVIDNVKLIASNRSRITDAIETAYDLAKEGVIIVNFNDKNEIIFNTQLACAKCGLSFEPLQPRSFSFNSPFGACPQCSGLGALDEFAVDLVVPDEDLSLNQGAIAPWATQMDGYRGQVIQSLSEHYHFNLDESFKNLPPKIKEILLFGSKEKVPLKFQSKSSPAYYHWDGYFEGAINQLERQYRQTESEERRSDMRKYMRSKPCPDCLGKRLQPEVLAVTVNEKNIDAVVNLPIDQCFNFITNLKLNDY